MLNPFKEVNWNPGLAERRKFARSLVIGFPCVALILLLAGRLHSHTGAWNFKPPLLVGGIGVAFGLLFLVLPAIAKPFYLVWYFVASCIGLVMGNLLLGVAFYVFFTIVGLLKRGFGRPAIRKTVDKQARTYWQDAEQPSDRQRYYRQF